MEVTMVGYDNEKFMIKNSWGSGWGSGGYIYMARNHHNCKLYTHSAIITLSGSGPDPVPDPTDAPDPDPTNGPDPDPDCSDAAPAQCGLYRDWMCRYQSHHCRKTCGLC